MSEKSGKMSQEKVMSERSACMIYLTISYSCWPEYNHTDHAAVSHYGYAWVQDKASQSWLLRDDSGDVITKSDWEFFQHPPKPSFYTPYTHESLSKVLNSLVGAQVELVQVPDAIRSASEKKFVEGDTESRDSLIIRSALYDLRAKGGLCYANLVAE